MKKKTTNKDQSKRKSRKNKTSFSKTKNFVSESIKTIISSCFIGVALAISIFFLVISIKMSYEFANALSISFADRMASNSYNKSPNGIIGVLVCTSTSGEFQIPVEEISHTLHGELVVRDIRTKQQIIIKSNCIIALN